MRCWFEGTLATRLPTQIVQQVVVPTVFDKLATVSTLDNDQDDGPFTYRCSKTSSTKASRP